MVEDKIGQEKSVYNEAMLQIGRLHELWLGAELYAKSGNFTNWKFILDSVWRELYADVLRLKNSKEVIKNNIKKLKLISKAKNRTQEYFALCKRHEFLKETQDKTGKGGAYQEENEGYE